MTERRLRSRLSYEGGKTMQTPHTYRQQAEICVRQADKAKTPNHRMILLNMAQTWLRMADESEAINKRTANQDPDKAA